MVRMRELATIALLNVAALGAIVWQLRDPRLGAVRIIPPPTATAGPTATDVALHVHVSGAVATPGVVLLPDGARIDDAVRAAGGLRPDADPAALNLAAMLQDGSQVHVVAVGEAPRTGGSEIVLPGQPDRQPVAAGTGSQIDLNRASATELESLPGIGPALAKRIVAHRAENGPYTTVEDLLLVSGIGNRTLEGFRDLVTVR